MTLGATFVILGENGGSADGQRASEFVFDGISEHPLATGQVHRREEVPVGKLGHAVGLAADADEVLHPFIVGNHLLVAHRPVLTESVVGCGFEVIVAQPIALARPHDGSPADVASADPNEGPVGRCGVRLFDVIDEEVMGVLVALVALLLDRLALLARLRSQAAPMKRHVERSFVLGEVGAAVECSSCFQDDDFQSRVGELFRDPPTGGAGADNDCVVRGLLAHWAPPVGC